MVGVLVTFQRDEIAAAMAHLREHGESIVVDSSGRVVIYLHVPLVDMPPPIEER